MRLILLLLLLSFSANSSELSFQNKINQIAKSNSNIQHYNKIYLQQKRDYALKKIGNELVNINELKLAKDVFMHLKRKRKSSYQIDAQLAYISTHLGEYNQAISLYEKIESNKLMSPTLVYNYTLALNKSKQSKKAKIVLLKYLKLKPENLILNFQLGNTYLQLGEIENAKKIYKSLTTKTRASSLRAKSYIQLIKLTKNITTQKELVNNLYQLSPQLSRNERIQVERVIKNILTRPKGLE